MRYEFSFFPKVIYLCDLVIYRLQYRKEAYKIGKAVLIQCTRISQILNFLEPLFCIDDDLIYPISTNLNSNTIFKI